tara:strand:+ start:938 stop:1171 length:234 start_codon:yes stop_codon:yes gene_type:complete
MDKLHIVLRIPEVSRLLEKNNEKVSSIVSKTNTDEDKKKLAELDKQLTKEIDYVNKIVKEVMHYVKEHGCGVSKNFV